MFITMTPVTFYEIVIIHLNKRHPSIIIHIKYYYIWYYRLDLSRRNFFFVFRLLLNSWWEFRISFKMVVALDCPIVSLAISFTSPKTVYAVSSAELHPYQKHAYLLLPSLCLVVDIFPYNIRNSMWFQPRQFNFPYRIHNPYHPSLLLYLWLSPK